MGGRVLVTGGAGYVGSHTCVELLLAGWDLVVVDDLSNGRAAAIERVVELAGSAVRRPVELYCVDVRDEPALDRMVAARGPFDACLHFAGRKSAPESIARPLEYYANNVGGTIALAQVLERRGVSRLVFSSSATVYGAPAQLPISEDAPLAPTTPYGHSKAIAERVLADAATRWGWGAALLRYFNPVGAHESARLGEHPGRPGNLVPLVAQVALGQRPVLDDTGTRWPTPDGTGVSDYVHVADVARAHLAALEWTGRVREARAFNVASLPGAPRTDEEMVRRN